MEVGPSTVKADSLAEQLLCLPGFVSAGIVRVGPAAGDEVFEVQWLRGHQLPSLPQRVDSRPLRIAILDTLDGMPPGAVAQRQESHEAADQAQALAPGSPINCVADAAWREFVSRLSREASTFASSRHVGQYRQRRERLAELGIDPAAIQGSPAAQRAALDSDLAEAYGHAAAGGLLGYLGRPIALPGDEGPMEITLSGMLGVIQCAGLDGAAGWLERPNDRKRYPHTTHAFRRTNGIF
jgi:hypothetical protein